MYETDFTPLGGKSIEEAINQLSSQYPIGSVIWRPEGRSYVAIETREGIRNKSGSVTLYEPIKIISYDHLRNDRVTVFCQRLTNPSHYWHFDRLREIVVLIHLQSNTLSVGSAFFFANQIPIGPYFIQIGELEVPIQYSKA